MVQAFTHYFPLLSFLIGLTAAGISQLFFLIRWYSSAKLKSYAAERDFEVLRRNQEQIKISIDDLGQSLVDLEKSVARLEGKVSTK